jgi:hypothetical protein
LDRLGRCSFDRRLASGLFLLSAFGVVHCLGARQAAAGAPAATAEASPRAGTAKAAKTGVGAPAAVVHRDNTALPAPVAEMREAILSAVRSGDIEELRRAFELNELKPDLGGDFARSPGHDPVAYWKQLSGDGKGLEILAVLGNILEKGYVVVPLGSDLENNRIYVWPYFAEIALDKLDPAQQVELLELVPPQAAKAMTAGGSYTHWRVSIGADGTWHAFRKDP